MQQVFGDQFSAHQKAVPFELVALLHRQVVDFTGILLKRVPVLSRPIVCRVDLHWKNERVVNWFGTFSWVFWVNTWIPQLTSSNSTKFLPITSDMTPLFFNCVQRKEFWLKFANKTSLLFGLTLHLQLKRTEKQNRKFVRTLINCSILRAFLNSRSRIWSNLLKILYSGSS